VPALAACGDDDDDDGGGNELTVGALLSLTGDWSTLGKTSQAALEIAAAEINKQSSSTGLPKVKIEVADTKLDPQRALSELQRMHDKGIRVVVGPQSSSEVAAIKDYAKANGIVVVSQGSTSSTLSVGGDTVYRLPPDDRRETEAMAALLKADGVTTIVPLWRADVGNQGLQNSIRTSFQAIGGKVTAGMEYPASNPDWPKVLDAAEQQVATAKQTGGNVAIYLAAFSEVVPLFEAASSRPALASLKWYGSDGVALAAELPASATASAFAQKTGYPNPIFGLDHSKDGESKWKPIADKIKDKSKIEPDAFGLSAYDALFLIAAAVKEAGGTDNADTLGRILAEKAAATQGITGSLKLNEAGDRAQGAFDFWIVCKNGANYEWVLNASYLPGSGTTTEKVSRLKTCS
jgi:branched-chain amino acid transport system substrate-binding protein